MRKYTRYKKFFPWLMLLCFLALAISLPIFRAAAEPSPIKVGYTDSPGFIAKDEETGDMRGLVYDYMERLAVYTGHPVNYIEGKPDELMNMLQSGQIDVITNFVGEPARKNNPLLDFSQHTIAKAIFYIVQKDENATPKKIGYLPSILAAKELTIALSENGLKEGTDFTLHGYATNEEMRAAYERGEVNAVITNSSDPQPDLGEGTRLLMTPTYYVVKKGNKEILSALDHASNELIMIAPSHRDELFTKHISSTMPLILTPAEMNYLKEHNEFKVSASMGRIPYSYYENGAKGILAEIAKIMADDLGVKITIVDNTGRQNAIEQFENRETDLLFDCPTNYNLGRKYGAFFSMPYMTLSYAFVGRRDDVVADKDKQRVAYVEGDYFSRDYICENYAPNQLIAYKNVQECLTAIANGDADITFVNTYTAEHDLQQGDFYKLVISTTTAFSSEICIGVHADADPMLIRIINKEIAHLDQGTLQNIINRELVEAPTNHSLRSYVQHNPMTFVIITLLLALVVFATALIYFNIKQRHSKELKEMAFTNPGTGLKNIRWFMNRVPELVSENIGALKEGRLYVIAVNIKQLENMRETYNRKLLNETLINQLKKLIQKNPWILAYAVTSDENKFYFLAAIPKDMDTIDASQQLMDGAEPLRLGNYIIKYDIITGFTKIDMGELNIERLMHEADTALNEAGSMGAPAFVFNDDMREKIQLESKIESLMQKALDEREFIVYLQPKYDIATHKTTGAEALVRWQSPELGFLMPGKFIDLFERNGFAVDLDYYMLEEICRYQKKRVEAGERNITISVNQSGLHITENKYLDLMAEISRIYALPKNIIELEITETAFVDFTTKESRSSARHILNTLKDLGFGTSMDDFCTGYSSIAMLQNLPMDVMKIDRSLLLAAEKTPRAELILDSVIQMGKSLNMRVLCEGIETEAQEQLLLKHGCPYGQGYLFGKPMPITEFADFLKEH